jgi:DNA-binding NarL/FixJ family response regulator
MPVSDGLAAMESIRKESPKTKFVVLSTYENPTYVARSVSLGASEYVLKGTSRKELIEAITHVYMLSEPGESSIMRRVRCTMAKKKEIGNEVAPLTNRETQVLRHIALGLSNREIGRALGISVETVKEHVQNLLKKVECSDRTQAAVWAVRNSLV